MKNFIFLLIYLFAQFTHADFATTKRVVQADVIQGTKSVENYIKDSPPKAANTKGWKCYADAAGVVPVDGVGGTSTVTFTSSSTTPLKSATGGGYIFTHLASNQQGMGCSYDFQIDLDDKAKMLDVNLSYIVRSGTFQAGGQSTDSDVEIFVYDITNATIVGSLSSNKLLSNNTTLSDLFQASFQSASNSTSYRLILHTSTTTANAFTLGFGDVSVARSKYVFGTPITDWVAYTPTLTGFTGPSGISFFSRRVGGDLEVKGYFVVGAVTASAASITPGYGGTNANVTIDNTKLPTSGIVGHAAGGTNSATFFGAQAITYLSTTAVGIGAQTPTNQAGTGAAGNVVATNGNALAVVFSVPIQGWASSVQMSSDAPAGPVVFAGRGLATTQAVTSSTDIQFVSLKDTLGGWNGSTYTIKSPGDYNIGAFIYSTASNFLVSVYKNGGFHKYGTYSVVNNGGGFNVIVENLVVGDVISLRTGAVTLAGDVAQNISISKIAGQATIAATESVNFKYSTTAGQSIANPFGSQVVWGTKDWDTHGMMNTSTGTWTFPVQGKYKVCAGLDYVSAVITAGNQRNVQFYKNGAAINYVINYPLASVTQAIAIFGCNLYNVVAGDTGAIWTNANESAARSLSTSGFTNYITLERVGN